MQVPREGGLDDGREGDYGGREGEEEEEGEREGRTSYWAASAERCPSERGPGGWAGQTNLATVFWAGRGACANPLTTRFDGSGERRVSAVLLLSTVGEKERGRKLKESFVALRQDEEEEEDTLCWLGSSLLHGLKIIEPRSCGAVRC